MAIVRRLGKVGAVLLLAVVSVAVVVVGGVFALEKSGVISTSACGGQCSSPYTLDVLFKPATNFQADSAIVQNCARNDREVVSFTPARLNPNRSGDIVSFVKTVDFGGPKVKPLIRCLDDSPLTAGEAAATYPD